MQGQSAMRGMELSIVYQPISALVPYARNAKIHKAHQIRQIAESIRTLGFNNPVLVDEKNTIIAGHGRVSAAKLLGIPKVPTICLANLSPDQVRAYVIADNRLAESSGWDEGILAIELQHLLTLDDFDITLTGFEIAEVDLILEEEAAPQDEEDVLDDLGAAPAITQAGDLWHLGKHRLLCASALDQSSFERLMGSRKANLVFTDPPYNVPIAGNVSGKGVVKHGDFAMASGEMSETEFASFLSTGLRLLSRHSSASAVQFVCIDWRHMASMLAAGNEVYDSLLNVCVWCKDNGAQGSFYRSQHELVFVFRNGKEKHTNIPGRFHTPPLRT